MRETICPAAPGQVARYPHLEDYEMWLRAAGYRADTTSRALRVAQMYLAASNGSDPWSAQAALAFLADAGGRVRRITLLNYHKDLAMFFRWGQAVGAVARSPLDHLPRPKLSVYERERDTRFLPYSSAEFGKLLTACGSGGWLAARDRAILWVLWDTPLRVGELCALRESDVSGCEVWVRDGKGGVRYEGLLSPEGEHALAAYLDARRQPDGPLFLDRAGSGLSRHAVEQFFRRLAVRCGFSKPLTPHLMRHNWRARMLSEGASEAYVSALMGHTTVRISQVYARQAVRQDAKAWLRQRRAS